MSARKTVQVICHECGMFAEIRMEALGLRYGITDIASHTKCKYEWRGMGALGCSGLKLELLKARTSLAREERCPPKRDLHLTRDHRYWAGAAFLLLVLIRHHRPSAKYKLLFFCQFHRNPLPCESPAAPYEFCLG